MEGQAKEVKTVVDKARYKTFKDTYGLEWCKKWLIIDKSLITKKD